MLPLGCIGFAVAVDPSIPWPLFALDRDNSFQTCSALFYQAPAKVGFLYNAYDVEHGVL